MLKVLLLAVVVPGMAFVPACPTHLAAASAPSSRTTSAVRASSAASDSAAPPKALLVVGAGVLGRRVAAQYHARGLGQVTAETRSEANHDAILAELPFLGRWDPKSPDPKGVVRTKAMGERGRDIFMKFGPQNFDNVVFCAPPSGNDDYAQEVRDAVKMWNRRGRFVFTSSTAVYADPLTVGEVCTEGSPLKSPLSEHPRAAKLLACEEACAAGAGGTVVRLAGLYHASRGAHSHFLKQGTLESNGAALVNLIHYDDAASLVVEAVLHGSKGAVYLGCDGVPQTRQALADAAGAALGGGCIFTGGPSSEGGRGRAMDNAWTRQALGEWAPQWASFEACMQAQAK